MSKADGSAIPMLVEQIRSLARCEHGDMTLGNDAADEIERLQTELAAVKSVQPEPVANDVLRPALQQAILALEELDGPGYLIGGVMHYRIGLLLPQLEEALASLASPPPAQPASNPWRDAIDEALVVAHLGVATEPYDDLNKLLQWHHDVCLDPAVSSDAQALIDQGVAEERARAAQPPQAEPVNWMPFALTVAAALDRGDDARMLFDENSPIRDELRTLIAKSRGDE